MMAGEVWDAPNQQTVRPDESPPWAEGDGAGGDVDGEPGTPLPDPEPPDPEEPPPDPPPEGGVKTTRAKGK
jgi:hypothetical protein